MLDAKWLEILKASGWKTAAIAAAAGLLVYLNTTKRLPVDVDHWVIQAAIVVLLLCGCLTVASIASYVLPKARGFVMRVWVRRQENQEVVALIPEFSETERNIIGYLLSNNQRTFTNTPDCGHAVTLVSKGIVVLLAQPGQHMTHYEVPFEIPAPVWKVLRAHAGAFPKVPEQRGQPHPWRRHWME